MLMTRYGLWTLPLLIGLWNPSFAAPDDGQLTPPSPPIAETDIRLIGGMVCGEGNFKITEGDITCEVCPKFTTNTDSNQGFRVTHFLRGRFTSSTAENEWILDTEGCEPRFANFGGTILLGTKPVKSVLGMPAVALGSSLAAKPPVRPLTFIYYKPGFRLDDCLVISGKHDRTQLVCNEAEHAQGEVIGHISSMEISRLGITRWRLLRWYDNSATDSPDVLSVIPLKMQNIKLDSGQPGVEITIKIVQMPREEHDKTQTPPGRIITLLFQRKGKRLFATPKTQTYLKDMSIMTREVFD